MARAGAYAGRRMFADQLYDRQAAADIDHSRRRRQRRPNAAGGEFLEPGEGGVKEDTLRLIVRHGKGHGWGDYWKSTEDIEAFADWFDTWLRPSTK
jgi:hypothetical protein